MSQPLYQLVYYSRNQVVGSPNALEAEIGSILAVSRRNNGLAGITGTLLFNAGCFAQVLEGPLDAIEATFERIQQDPRHGEVALLAMEPIEQRCFSNWAMGFVGQAEENARRFAEIGIASGFDPSRLDGKRIHAILRELTLGEEFAIAA